MLDPCCTTMRTMTMTQQDLEGDPDLSRGITDLSQWKPLIEWADHVGAFVIGHTVIFHCPWCGTRLPEKVEETLARARRSGIWFDVSADGEVTVTVNGEPADPEAFLAELRASTKDQN